MPCATLTRGRACPRQLYAILYGFFVRGVETPLQLAHQHSLSLLLATAQEAFEVVWRETRGFSEKSYGLTCTLSPPLFTQASH